MWLPNISTKYLPTKPNPISFDSIQNPFANKTPPPPKSLISILQQVAVARAVVFLFPYIPYIIVSLENRNPSNEQKLCLSYFVCSVRKAEAVERAVETPVLPLLFSLCLINKEYWIKSRGRFMLGTYRKFEIIYYKLWVRAEICATGSGGFVLVKN